MSYTDIDRPTVQPGSVAAAVLINGGAVLAILFAGSTIVERIKDKPIKTQWFDNPKTVPEEVVTKDQPRDTKEPVATRAKRTEGAKEQVSENDLTGTVAGTAGGDGGDPRYTSDLQPQYPQSMARAGESGRVTVRVRIGKDGRVTEVQILSSTSEEFAEATKRQALRKWRFIAATRDGTAEDSWREMTVKFEMPD
jgi:periplasmic protein TonB